MYLPRNESNCRFRLASESRSFSCIAIVFFKRSFNAAFSRFKLSRSSSFAIDTEFGFSPSFEASLSRCTRLWVKNGFRDDMDFARIWYNLEISSSTFASIIRFAFFKKVSWWVPAGERWAGRASRGVHHESKKYYIYVYYIVYICMHRFIYVYVYCIYRIYIYVYMYI